MKFKNIITILSLLISIVSIAAAGLGIFSNRGNGPFQHVSIHNKSIIIYGKGLYENMSADVAIQGIAQDYVTLFLGVPLLLISLYFYRKGSVKGLIVHAGVLGYFLATYLFYTAMAIYNIMFLGYVFLLSCSFFCYLLVIISFKLDNSGLFSNKKIFPKAGIFLIINGLMIMLLWLSVIIPPLLDGSIYPKSLEHYTTLIVQGFDLALFLPMAIISGILAIKKNPYGYLFTSIYMISLSILMTALVSKIIFMANVGQNVIPVIFIMPTILIIGIIFSFLILKQVNKSYNLV